MGEVKTKRLFYDSNVTPEQMQVECDVQKLIEGCKGCTFRYDMTIQKWVLEAYFEIPDKSQINTNKN